MNVKQKIGLKHSNKNYNSVINKNSKMLNLLYRVHCGVESYRCCHCYNISNMRINCKNNNNDNNKNINNRKKYIKSSKYLHQTYLLTIVQVYGIILFSTLLFRVQSVQGASVYSNVNFLTNPNFESICNTPEEYFIESDGKESSLILEFTSPILGDKTKSCTRILSTPDNYGFIVRLILPKIRHGHHQQATSIGASPSSPPSSVSVSAAAAASASASSLSTPQLQSSSPVTSDEINSEYTDSPSQTNPMISFIEKLNASTSTLSTMKSIKTSVGRTCPLSVFSSHDPHTPQWRVDPCQLEDTAPEMEDPVRLFHGRVRIVWEHGQNTLKSKLMVTVLGKGDQCRKENKHQCLKIGDEPILCISKDLICDGIRHCPYSNEYDSDEDYAMCWKRRRLDEPIPPAMESDIFEHFALEVFRNLFAYDAPTIPDNRNNDEAAKKTLKNTSKRPPLITNQLDTTTLRKVDTKEMLNTTVSGAGASNDTVATGSGVDGSTESGGNHHRRNSTRSGLSSDLSKYGPWGYLMLGMLLCGGALLICGLWASASQHAANNEREAAMQANVGGAGYNGNSMESSNGAPPNYDELDPPPAYSVLFPNQKAASSATLNSLATATASAAVATAITMPSLSAQFEGVTASSSAGSAHSHPAIQ